MEHLEREFKPQKLWKAKLDSFQADEVNSAPLYDQAAIQSFETRSGASLTSISIHIVSGGTSFFTATDYLIASLNQGQLPNLQQSQLREDLTSENRLP